MARLTEAERNVAIGMLLTGASQANTARLMRCNRSTIVDLWRRYQQHGTVADRPRVGRPRVTTPQQDLYIRVTHARNRRQTAVATARTTIGHHNRPVNEHTVRRRLREAGMINRRPYHGPVLTQRHRQNRLAWARGHAGWSRQRWASVLFTDESKFNVSNADGRQRIYRRRNERYADCCVVEHNRFGGGSVMVWAGISADFKTQLHVVQGRVDAVYYRDNILQPIALPFLNNNGLAILQHDNARPHTARVTTNFLAANGVNVLMWPSLSPDLNPIEHAWDELGRRVASRPVQPLNCQQLAAALVHEWGNIPQNVIRRLVTSMRRRCAAVVTARGGHTRY